MHVAAFYDSLETFLFLFNRGFSLEVKTANEFQPIHYAAIGGATEVAAFLCFHNSPSIHNAPGDTGLSPLYLATSARCPEIVRYLSDAGVRINDVRHGSRIISSVQCAIDNKDIECLTVLLERWEVTRQVLTKEFSPLMRAISNNLTDAVELLLKNGADPNYQTPHGQNALYVACNKDSLESVQLLLEYGYDTTKTGFLGVSFVFTRAPFTGRQPRPTLRSSSCYSKKALTQPLLTRGTGMHCSALSRATRKHGTRSSKSY